MAGERYAVAWAEPGGAERVGELTLGPGYLAIDDRTRDVCEAWLPAEQILSVDEAPAGDSLSVRASQTRLLVTPFEGDHIGPLAERLRAFAASPPRATPLELLVAGGGVAALEAALAVRELAGDRVSVTLVSTEADFTYRPLTVREPFGTPLPRVPLEAVARDVSATLHIDRLASVEPDAQTATTEAGLELAYDVLLIALGATPRPALAGALTFWSGAAEGFRRLLADVDGGRVGRVAFVVPTGVAWALPLYELAMLTAVHAAARTPALDLLLVTSEPASLGLLGDEASAITARLLADRGVELLTGRHAAAVEPGALVLAGGTRISADRVVALPRLEGPRLAGVPCDAGGFLPTDRFGHVGGLPRVLAAGDATAFPIKQGGIAVQQAGVAAAVVAARAGAPVTPTPFDPLLQAQLFTGRAPLFVRSKLEIGVGRTEETGREPLWQPPSKIAGGRLSEYLGARRARLHM